MIPLPKTFKRKEYNHSFLKRYDHPVTNKGAAIYEQRDGERLVSYEVFEIQKQFNDELGPGGAIYKAKERVPGDGSWGISGWTFAAFTNPTSALEQAEEKFNELKIKIDNHADKNSTRSTDSNS